MKRLAELNDGRLRKSCEIAHSMCMFRDRTTDPKPWFYSGLFSMATEKEAIEFLGTHRITKALVPSMRNDEGVRLWLERVGPETHELVNRIRAGLDHLME